MPPKSKLLITPQGTHGEILNITPENVKERCPHWAYVGFSLHKLKMGEKLELPTETLENLLVLVTGTMTAQVNGVDYGDLGHRFDIFGREPAHALYVPNDCTWEICATSDVELAVCRAPGNGGHKPRVIRPNNTQSLEERGKGSNTRYVHAIMMEERSWADSLLVTEVWTPNGHWSSYPSHKHDTDNWPHETYLEETYYHRLNPRQGFGYQRVYNDSLSLDENMAVSDGDVVLVPEGYHPCGAPYGYDMYYLNVMAGPRRNWRFQNDPNHEWLFLRDSGKKPEG